LLGGLNTVAQVKKIGTRQLRVNVQSVVLGDISTPQRGLVCPLLFLTRFNQVYCNYRLSKHV